MNEDPFYNEPGVPTMPVFSTRYSDRVRHDTVRVAICDAVEACLQEQPPYPPYLASAVLKTFADSYDKYEDMVQRLVQLNSSWRLSWILGGYGHVPVRAAAVAAEAAWPTGQG
ncbi:hypothetical protein MTO96_049923 [Rhipicephalus appendiculatus]